MQKQAIINKFMTYMGDTSELSSQDLSDLFDKILAKVYSDRPWEFLKKSYVTTQSTTLPYVALPSDFRYFVDNYDYQGADNASRGPVAFVGSSYSPVSIVNWGNRRQYRNNSSVAYADFGNRRLVFGSQPTSAQSMEFDYYYMPTALGDTEEPIFPSEFHDIVYHGMCADDFVIQLFDRARTYREEHLREYASYLERLCFYNANLLQFPL